MLSQRAVVLGNDTGQLRSGRFDLRHFALAAAHKGRRPKFETRAAVMNGLNPGHKTDIGRSGCVHAGKVELLSGKKSRGELNHIALLSAS